MRPYAHTPITTRGSGGSGRWPGGKALAVYVAVGVEEYRAEGVTEDVLVGVPEPDLVNHSWRDYGNRVGAFRLLDLLGECGIPPTVLLNTLVYDTAPAVTDAARRAGAEIVGHGVSNSDTLAGMDRRSELDYVKLVAERIDKEEGIRPGGWSSPWLVHTPSTFDVLAEAGYRYLLGLRPDDRPVWLPATPSAILAIPYAIELNDSTTIIGRNTSASDFADMIVDEFDELLAGADQPIVMSIVVHSFISGVPFRTRQLRRALTHIGTRADEVWLTQPRHIYRHYAGICPPPPAH